MTKNKSTFLTTVAFVGLPNVGKSTLLNALVGTKIAPTTRKPQTTRRIIRGIKTVGNCQHIYFDTPGAVRKDSGLDRFMHGQIFQALNDVDQVVAIVDGKDVAKRHLGFLEKVKTNAEKNQQRLLIAINKVDEIKDKGRILQLIKDYSEALGIEEIIPISAIKKTGLKELFETMSTYAKPSPFLFSSEDFTDASEKDIVAELIREKAMLELSDELPYRIAVTIDHFDESRREDEKRPLIDIEAILHVERKSQKPIVIGKGGATIKAIGTRARKDIEYLLQCQVMLRLFIRVESMWTSSGKGLRKLGY